MSTFRGSGPDAILKQVSGYPFYNTSRYTLEKLLAEPAQLHRNLKTYLEAFSPNIRMILDKNEGLDFFTQIDKMHKGSRLTGVVRKFSELDLAPERINNVAMGYMFEELIRRFSENAEAGDHYTPREVVRLLVRLGLAEGSEDLFEPGKNINVADQMGDCSSALSGWLVEHDPCVRQRGTFAWRASCQ